MIKLPLRVAGQRSNPVFIMPVVFARSRVTKQSCFCMKLEGDCFTAFAMTAKRRSLRYVRPSVRQTGNDKKLGLLHYVRNDKRACSVASGEPNVGEYDFVGDTECCGDDANEYFITKGNGPNKCCRNSNTCVDGDGACQSGTSESSANGNCGNGIDNDCDGLTDCDEADCACTWRVETGECAASYSSGNIGTCYLQETGKSDNCGDGFLTYAWTALWEWNSGNYIYEDPESTDYVYEGEPVNAWHYDPINLFTGTNKSRQCIDGSNTIACPAQIQLPFFNAYNLIVTLIVIILIYIIINSVSKKKPAKKRKKK